MTSLVLTLTETLRYRGAIGQWSWVLHRITGIGVVFFLTLHVIDTSWAVFYPDMYEHAVAAYQSPLFTIGEFALVACVVYHALNGIRIGIFDARPKLWKYQQRAVVIVLALTVLILLPTFIGMFGHVIKHYNGNPFILPIDQVLLGQAPFIGGMVVAFIAALLLSALYGLIAGNKRLTFGKTGPSATEKFWWSFMRISGLLILPLVFGHLAMMHVLQGVFDLTAPNSIVVGTSAINESGTATEFVIERWSHVIFDGVYIWRIYDIALLALVTVHGFNGLRYVLTDYFRHPILRRAMALTCLIGAVILLVVGGAALLTTVDEKSIQMAQEAITRIRQGAGH